MCSLYQIWYAVYMILHHVAISVADIDETVSWYGTHFGFVEQHRYDTSDMTFCMLEKDGFRLELISHLSEFQQQPMYRSDLLADLKVGGAKHFCLTVPDAKMEYERLKQAGVEVRNEPKEAGFGGQYFFVKDNNGILFEIWSEA